MSPGCCEICGGPTLVEGLTCSYECEDVRVEIARRRAAREHRGADTAEQARRLGSTAEQAAAEEAQRVYRRTVREWHG